MNKVFTKLKQNQQIALNGKNAHVCKEIQRSVSIKKKTYLVQLILELVFP
jgi:hypothetical protein